MPSCGAILAPSNRRAETLIRRLPPASPAPAGQLASGERVDSALRALAARYSRHSPGRVAVQTAPRSLITSPRRLPACAGMPTPRTQTLSFPSAVRYYTTKPLMVEWQDFARYKARQICRARASALQTLPLYTSTRLNRATEAHLSTVNFRRWSDWRGSDPRPQH